MSVNPGLQSAVVYAGTALKQAIARDEEIESNASAVYEVIEDVITDLEDEGGQYDGMVNAPSDLGQQVSALTNVVRRLVAAETLDENEIEESSNDMISILDNLIQAEDWQSKLAEAVDGFEAVQSAMDSIDSLVDLYQTAVLTELVDEQALADGVQTVKDMIGTIPVLGSAIDAVISGVKGVLDTVIAGGATVGGIMAVLGESIRFLTDAATTLAHFVAAMKGAYEMLTGEDKLLPGELDDLVDLDEYMKTAFAEMAISLGNGLHAIDDASHARKGKVITMWRSLGLPIETLEYVPKVILNTLKAMNKVPAHEVLMMVSPLPPHEVPDTIPAAAGNEVPVGVMLMSVGDNFEISGRNILKEALKKDGIRPGDLSQLGVNKCMLYAEYGYGRLNVVSAQLTMPTKWANSLDWYAERTESRVDLEDCVVRRVQPLVVSWGRAISEAQVFIQTAIADVKVKGADSPFAYRLLGQNCQYYSGKFYEAWTQGTPLAMMAIVRFADGGVVQYHMRCKSAQMYGHLLSKERIIANTAPTFSLTRGGDAKVLQTDVAYNIAELGHPTRARTLSALYEECRTSLSAPFTPAQVTYMTDPKNQKFPTFVRKPSPMATAYLDKYRGSHDITNSAHRLHRVLH